MFPRRFFGWLGGLLFIILFLPALASAAGVGEVQSGIQAAGARWIAGETAISQIPVEEFQKIDSEKLYLMAGERRCNFNVASSGIINGKPQVKLATIVPRQGLEFKLFAGDYPPKTFKAEEKIYDRLD